MKYLSNQSHKPERQTYRQRTALCTPHQKKTASVMLTLAALGFGTAVVTAQESFQNCALLTDNAERLACYDQVAGQVSSDDLPETEQAEPVSTPLNRTNQSLNSTEVTEGGNPLPVIEQEAVPRVESTAPADSVTSVPDEFGFENGRQAEVEEEEREEEVRQIIVADASYNRFTGWRIKTESGQVWQQIGADEYRIRVGERYEIVRGMFNSFQLGGGNTNRKIRVRREQ